MRARDFTSSGSSSTAIVSRTWRIWSERVCEFRRRDTPSRCDTSAREARGANCALEVIHQIDPHPDRRAARTLGIEMNLGRAFLHAVHVVPELAAVVHGCHVIPLSERVKAFGIDERLFGSAAVHVAVEIPLPSDDPELEQHAVVAAGLLQMEPALCRLASVRTEDGLPRER